MVTTVADRAIRNRKPMLSLGTSLSCGGCLVVRSNHLFGSDNSSADRRITVG